MTPAECAVEINGRLGEGKKISDRGVPKNNAVYVGVKAQQAIHRTGKIKIGNTRAVIKLLIK